MGGGVGMGAGHGGRIGMGGRVDMGVCAGGAFVEAKDEECWLVNKVSIFRRKASSLVAMEAWVNGASFIERKGRSIKETKTERKAESNGVIKFFQVGSTYYRNSKWFLHR